MFAVMPEKLIMDPLSRFLGRGEIRKGTFEGERK